MHRPDGHGPLLAERGLTLEFAPTSVPPQAVSIIGTGSYVPERAVSNDEVGGPAGVDDAWIRRKTGIASRRWADPSSATSDLAARAATAALRDSGVDPSEIKLLVVATSTPDHSQPPTAAILQDMIGAENAAAYDLNSVCSGFEFALNSVTQLIATTGGYALVVGADLYSRILNPTDRRTVVLFGDGAGAVVLGLSSESPGPTVVAGKMCTYGHLSDVIQVPMGGSRLPFAGDPTDELRYFQMAGRDVRSFVTTTLPGVIRAFLSEVGVDPREVRHLIPHQANGVMLDELVTAMGFPDLTHHLVVERYANTGSASIPLTLDIVRRESRVTEGDLVLMAGFGGGMSVGLTLLRW
ncbi:3-oxoacyl-ACP synthase III family protein [Sanguibacter sp. Leaf3]|uniref:3-oxoacyl-ACP synthase III family protein n=1 Tax=Sanguibacter sp. Leaf3 TaxID=1736209 RepID=UPI0009EBF344|nr:ketoacyl-ACP synthase III [Sanguibacter sp. Leaf3]